MDSLKHLLRRSNDLQVGTGFVEISALTTLIGSSTAESLILGDKAGPGVAWASLSAFGSLSVIKGCIAGAAPNWLRATLGVRNASTDDAVGLRLDLRSKYRSSQDLARRDLGKAQGLTVSRRRRKDDGSPDSVPDFGTMQDVYAFDRFTTKPLESALISPPHGMPVVYSFVRDPYHRTVTTGDWVALGLSMVKVLEVYTLWRLGAGPLCWVTAAPWSFFFLSALVLQGLRISRSYKPDDASEVDVLAGDLPTAKVLGGEYKVMLDMPQNFRSKLLWRFVWALGALICVPVLLGTYLLLGSELPVVVYAWVAFQLLWLVLRLILYHVVSGADHIVYPGLVAQDWKSLSPRRQQRLFVLMMALARYQTHEHPRGSYSYEEDLLSFEKISPNGEFLQLLQENFQLTVTLDPNLLSKVQIQVLGILGDTVLASAAWLSGSKLTGMDLYDTAIIFIEVSGHKVAITAVRVLSGSTMQNIIAASKLDPELAVGRHRSTKGLTNAGFGITWLYWIPCADGRWLQLASENMKIIGNCEATILDDAGVTAKLDSSEVNVSLATAEDVKATLDFGRKGAKALMNMI